MSNDSNKKYKRPKQKTLATTNPDAPVSQRPSHNRDEDRSECPEQICPLLAKDSEWVDILMQAPFPNPVAASSSNIGDDEAILQLVECEDGPQMKPLAIMFPGLLEKDPQTLERMLTKTMSTTEVTRHLVDLGEKADFTCMKQSNKLIPRDKQWLESLTENSNSHCSLSTNLFSSGFSSACDADAANTKESDRMTGKGKKTCQVHVGRPSTEDSLYRFEVPSINNSSRMSSNSGGRADVNQSNKSQKPSQRKLKKRYK